MRAMHWLRRGYARLKACERRQVVLFWPEPQMDLTRRRR
jgi:hypothetical protein